MILRTLFINFVDFLASEKKTFIKPMKLSYRIQIQNGFDEKRDND